MRLPGVRLGVSADGLRCDCEHGRHVQGEGEQDDDTLTPRGLPEPGPGTGYQGRGRPGPLTSDRRRWGLRGRNLARRGPMRAGPPDRPVRAHRSSGRSRPNQPADPPPISFPLARTRAAEPMGRMPTSVTPTRYQGWGRAWHGCTATLVPLGATVMNVSETTWAARCFRSSALYVAASRTARVTARVDLLCGSGQLQTDIVAPDTGSPPSPLVQATSLFSARLPPGPLNTDRSHTRGRKRLSRPAGAGMSSARTWHNAFNRLQRCYERRKVVIDAFFDLADAIITVRALIRRAWTLYRWDTRPRKRL